MADGNNVTPETAETRAAFGRRIGCSGQYVGRLARHGYVVLDDRGRVRVAASIRRLRDACKLPGQPAQDLEAELRAEVDRTLGCRDG